MRVAFVRHDPVGSVLANVLRARRERPAGNSGQANGETPATPARLDVVDKGDRFAVTVDLPGLTREDIFVAVEGTRISVSGAARVSAQAGAQPGPILVLHAERRAANYARTLDLPVEVDAASAEASFENGVLTLNLPKRVQAAQITVR
jgi:HSP20 family protein